MTSTYTWKPDGPGLIRAPKTAVVPDETTPQK